MVDEILDTAGQKETKEPIWRAFLTAFSELGSFGGACKAIGVKHSTVRNALKNVPEFKELYKEAQEILADRLEDAMFERAEKGVRTLKFNKDGDACIDPATGKPYEEMKFDTVASIVRLKALRPELYIEKRAIVGADGGPLEMRVSCLADLVRLATGEDPTKKSTEFVTKAESLAK